MSPIVLERFWNKVNKDGPVPSHCPELGACWLWVGAKVEGYGSFAPPGRLQQGAHRISWAIAHGAIPRGLWVLHRCDVRACVNPSHLFVGTPADNNRDRESKGRGVYLIGSDHPASKLTAEQVLEIRGSYVPGVVTQKALAHRFGVTRESVRAILQRKVWTHV